MRLRHFCTMVAVAAVAVGCSGDGSTPAGPDVDSARQGFHASKFAVSGTDAALGSVAYCGYQASTSSASALAKPVGDSGNPNFTVFSTDFVSAGVGGMRNIGNGTIVLGGVTGPVSQALLYWHGLTDSDTDVGNAITVNGNLVVGTNIGYSDDNCWSSQNSQAYRADVTALVQVTGNGNYDLSGFGAMNPNGASLIVFFDDGDNSNNRDAVIYEGNDSNIEFAGIPANPLAPFDPEGWDVTLSGINYTAGTAAIELHVADGQTFTDDALILNGSTLEPGGGIFDGNTVPGTDPDGPNDNGNLWDIRSWDVTSFLSPGPNSLSLTTGVAGDCLGLIVAIVDLPAGAAPNQPAVADAGDDVTVDCAPPGGVELTLDGTGSFDPEGGPLTFLWTAVPGVVFDDPTSPTPTATFPPGVTVVTLTVTDQDGDSGSDDVVITINADVEAPVVACVETNNPSGKNVPTAGKNPKSGQNPDGFYMLRAADGCDDSPAIFLRDNATGTVFGPFESGVKIKLTQAPGAPPSIKPMAGDIDWHIKIKGDAEIFAVDDSGNISDPHTCYVPPLPK